MESKSEQGVASSIIVVGGYPLATSTPLESALRRFYSDLTLYLTLSFLTL